MDILWIEGKKIKRFEGIVLQAVTDNYSLSAFTESWHDHSQTNYFGQWISPKELECQIPLGMCNEFLDAWTNIRLSASLKNDVKVYLVIDEPFQVWLTGFRLVISEDQNTHATLILSVASFNQILFNETHFGSSVSIKNIGESITYQFRLGGIPSYASASMFHLSTLDYIAKEKVIYLNDNRTIMSTGKFPSEISLSFNSAFDADVNVEGETSLVSSIINVSNISPVSFVKNTDSKIVGYKQYSLSGVIND